MENVGVEPKIGVVGFTPQIIHLFIGCGTNINKPSILGSHLYFWVDTHVMKCIEMVDIKCINAFEMISSSASLVLLRLAGI